MSFAKTFVDRVRNAGLRLLRELDPDRWSLDEIAAVLVVVWVIRQMVTRLQYGVDGTDEAFYCALTHRYALGDWPYVDEVNLRQTAGLFAVPAYWLWIKIRGDTDGVVLLLRAVYFFITCGVGVSIYAYARPRIGRACALLVGLAPVAFFPFALPTCSYNNLGCMMFTLGTFLALRAASLEGKRGRRGHYWSGIAHALALVAYPPYIVPVVVCGAIQLFVLPGDRWKRTLHYFLGGATVGILFALILSRAGVTGVHQAFEYETALVAPRTEAKLINVLNDLYNHAPGQPATIALVLGWLAAAKTWRGFRLWGTLALVPLLGWIYGPLPQAMPPAPDPLHPPWADTPFSTLATAAQGLDQHVRCIYYAAYTCFAAVLVLPFVPAGRTRRELTWIGWVPSLVASLTTAYASANIGAINAGLGAFAGAIVTIVAVPLAAGRAQGELPPVERQPLRTRIIGAVLAASLATVALAHVRYAKRTMYRDAPMEELGPRVTTGPYRWLHTTPTNVDRMNVMVRKLRQLERPDGKVFAYYDYPAVYLVTLMRPAMPSVWTDARIPISAFMSERYTRNITGRGFIVRMTGVQNQVSRSHFEDVLEAPARLEFEDQYFKVYAEPDPALLR